MWTEWGIARKGGRFRKGHIPGMFAAIWHHPAAKYVGVIGLVIPFVVMIYYHRSRTHLGLEKDTPDHRPASGTSTGPIVAIPEVGGLHHRYERRAA